MKLKAMFHGKVCEGNSERNIPSTPAEAPFVLRCFPKGPRSSRHMLWRQLCARVVFLNYTVRREKTLQLGNGTRSRSQACMCWWECGLEISMNKINTGDFRGHDGSL